MVPPAVDRLPLMSCCAAALMLRQLPPPEETFRLPAIWKTLLTPVASAKTVLDPPPATKELPSAALPMTKLLVEPEPKTIFSPPLL